jgi:O-antigen/teichoic acid export membrane protein
MPCPLLPGAGVSGAAVLNTTANVIANFFGQGWRALLSLALIPLYIRYLGVEAYGLIGIFTILQSLLSAFDMGMRPTLSREMARFTAGARDGQSIRDLLRSVEIIGVAIACTAGLGLWFAAPWLASGWLRVESLPLSAVAQAFRMVAVVIALRFVESIYVSSLVGLQLQVRENVVSGAMATLRDLGAVGVLIWLSPTVTAFFAWHGLVSLLTVVVLSISTYQALPAVDRAGRYSASALLGIRHFAAGMTVITLLALLLTQLDKILVARLLPLKEFTHYAVAGMVASALHILVAPIAAAFSPRLAELVARKDESSLRHTYHQAAQMVSVLTGSAAVLLIAFGDTALLVWTADSALTQKVAPLARILTVGTLLNALMWIPYQLQLAHGWTSLGAKINSVAVAVLVPALFWIVPKHGAAGAAWVWVALNAGYLVFTIYFMHRRLLPLEKWSWYTRDVAMPLLAAAFAALLCSYLLPRGTGRFGQLLLLLTGLALVSVSAAMATPLMRQYITTRLVRTFTSSHKNAG